MRKAAEAAPEILKKATPIAFEGAARVVTLLPGLLLAPVNGNADPAKDRDWQLYHRNHTQQPAIPPPPPPDKVRLAQLERALEAQTLTAQEEADNSALVN